MTRILLFSYGYAGQIINNRKNAAALLVISMAIRIRRYGAERIAQYGRSRATLDATGLRHWAIIRPVLPRRTPILRKTSKLWRCEITFRSSDYTEHDVCDTDYDNAAIITLSTRLVGEYPQAVQIENGVICYHLYDCVQESRGTPTDDGGGIGWCNKTCNKLN